MNLFKETMNIVSKATMNIDLDHNPTTNTYEMSKCASSKCAEATQPLHAASMFLLVFMFLAALLGNLVVIVSILYTRSLRRYPSGRFILSLALSDLLVTVFIIPSKLIIVSRNLYFCYGASLCRSYITIDNILFVASITSLFVLTVDRYIGLEYGFGFIYTRFMTKTRVKLIVMGIWVYALFWGVAANIDWFHTGPSIVITDELECEQNNKYYVTVVLVIVFFIPIIIMGFLYIKIFRIAHRHASEINALHKNVKLGSYDSLSLLKKEPSNLSLMAGYSKSPVSVRSMRSQTTLTTLSITEVQQWHLQDSLSSRKTRECLNRSKNWISLRYYFCQCGRCSIASSTVSGTIDHELSSQEDTDNKTTGAESHDKQTRENCPRTLTPKSFRRRVNRHNSVVKATKTVAGVCGCFLICWLPVTVLAIGSNESFSNIQSAVHIIIVELLPVLNSTINPFIYSLMNSTYRKAFRRVIRDAKNMLQMHSLSSRF